MVGAPTARPQSSPVRILTLCEPRRRQGKLAAHLVSPGRALGGLGDPGRMRLPSHR